MDYCQICNYKESLETLMKCSNTECSVAVHKKCYGITDFSTNWKCLICKEFNKFKPQTCIFCHYNKGPMKPLAKGGWCHIICAIYLKNVYFLKPEILEKIYYSEDESSKQSCYICKKKGKDSHVMKGFKIKCEHYSCLNYMHPTCGLNKLLLTFDIQKHSNKTAVNVGKYVKYITYCETHHKKNQPVRAFDPPPCLNTLIYKIPYHKLDEKLKKQYKLIHSCYFKTTINQPLADVKTTKILVSVTTTMTTTPEKVKFSSPHCDSNLGSTSKTCTPPKRFLQLPSPTTSTPKETVVEKIAISKHEIKSSKNEVEHKNYGKAAAAVVEETPSKDEDVIKDGESGSMIQKQEGLTCQGSFAKSGSLETFPALKFLEEVTSTAFTSTTAQQVIADKLAVVSIMTPAAPFLPPEAAAILKRKKNSEEDEDLKERGTAVVASSSNSEDMLSSYFAKFKKFKSGPSRTTITSSTKEVVVEQEGEGISCEPVPAPETKEISLNLNKEDRKSTHIVPSETMDAPMTIKKDGSDLIEFIHEGGSDSPKTTLTTEALIRDKPGPTDGFHDASFDSIFTTTGPAESTTGSIVDVSPSVDRTIVVHHESSPAEDRRNLTDSMMTLTCCVSDSVYTFTNVSSSSSSQLLTHKRTLSSGMKHQHPHLVAETLSPPKLHRPKSATSVILAWTSTTRATDGRISPVRMSQGSSSNAMISTAEVTPHHLLASSHHRKRGSGVIGKWTPKTTDDLRNTPEDLSAGMLVKDDTSPNAKFIYPSQDETGVLEGGGDGGSNDLHKHIDATIDSVALGTAGLNQHAAAPAFIFTRSHPTRSVYPSTTYLPSSIGGGSEGYRSHYLSETSVGGSGASCQQQLFHHHTLASVYGGGIGGPYQISNMSDPSNTFSSERIAQSQQPPFSDDETNGGGGGFLDNSSANAAAALAFYNNLYGGGGAGVNHPSGSLLTAAAVAAANSGFMHPAALFGSPGVASLPPYLDPNGMYMMSSWTAAMAAAAAAASGYYGNNIGGHPVAGVPANLYPHNSAVVAGAPTPFFGIPSATGIALNESMPIGSGSGVSGSMTNLATTPGMLSGGGGLQYYDYSYLLRNAGTTPYMSNNPYFVGQSGGCLGGTGFDPSSSAGLFGKHHPHYDIFTPLKDSAHKDTNTLLGVNPPPSSPSHSTRIRHRSSNDSSSLAVTTTVTDVFSTPVPALLERKISPLPSGLHLDVRDRDTAKFITSDKYFHGKAPTTFGKITPLVMTSKAKKFSATLGTGSGIETATILPSSPVLYSSFAAGGNGGGVPSITKKSPVAAPKLGVSRPLMTSFGTSASRSSVDRSEPADSINIGSGIEGSGATDSKSEDDIATASALNPSTITVVSKGKGGVHYPTTSKTSSSSTKFILTPVVCRVVDTFSTDVASPINLTTPTRKNIANLAQRMIVPGSEFFSGSDDNMAATPPTRHPPQNLPPNNSHGSTGSAGGAVNNAAFAAANNFLSIHNMFQEIMSRSFQQVVAASSATTLTTTSSSLTISTGGSALLSQRKIPSSKKVRKDDRTLQLSTPPPISGSRQHLKQQMDIAADIGTRTKVNQSQHQLQGDLSDNSTVSIEEPPEYDSTIVQQPTISTPHSKNTTATGTTIDNSLTTDINFKANVMANSVHSIRPPPPSSHTLEWNHQTFTNQLLTFNKSLQNSSLHHHHHHQPKGNSTVNNLWCTPVKNDILPASASSSTLESSTSTAATAAALLSFEGTVDGVVGAFGQSIHVGANRSDSPQSPTNSLHRKSCYASPETWENVIQAHVDSFMKITPGEKASFDLNTFLQSLSAQVEENRLNDMKLNKLRYKATQLALENNQLIESLKQILIGYNNLGTGGTSSGSPSTGNLSFPPVVISHSPVSSLPGGVQTAAAAAALNLLNMAAFSYQNNQGLHTSFNSFTQTTPPSLLNPSMGQTNNNLFKFMTSSNSVVAVPPTTNATAIG